MKKYMAGKETITLALMEVYQKMLGYFGPLNWWPAQTPFEVCIGAILTQNTAWSNVEKAIFNLKSAESLSPKGIKTIDLQKLATLIRPSGYYNQKAKKLKYFVRFFTAEYGSSFRRWQTESVELSRKKLLLVNGIGPETADSILLYALHKPVFVVDAYTRRIFSRHGFFPENSTYDQIQAFFTLYLPQEVSFYNEFHAQVVYMGKTFCRVRPLCKECPLNQGMKEKVGIRAKK
jgi:endonuclease-3 related protein